MSTISEEIPSPTPGAIDNESEIAEEARPRPPRSRSSSLASSGFDALPPRERSNRIDNARKQVAEPGYANPSTHFELQQSTVNEWLEANSQPDTTGLNVPAGLKGEVSVQNGCLTSGDRTINALLQFATAQNPEAAKKVMEALSGQSVSLTLPVEQQILLKARQFENGCKISRIPLSDGTTEVVEEINLAVYAAREAIKKGSAAFGRDAKLSLTDADSSETPTPHPFDFLASVRFSAETDNPELKALIDNCLNTDNADTLDVRGRLGAEAIKTVLTEKQINKSVGYALTGSLVLAGGIGVALDMFAWRSVVSQISQTHGENHPLTRLAAVALPSLTPLFAETADSLILKRFLGTLEGEKMLWDSIGTFIKDMKEAGTAGALAALASIPNNVLSLFKGHPALAVASVPTDTIATIGSAALFPRVVMHRHDKITKAVMAATAAGFYPPPAGLTAKNEPALGKKLREHYKRETEGALGAMKDTSLVINSLGIGPLVSVPVNAILDIQQRMGKLSDSVNVPVTIALNTPTEIISSVIHMLGRYVSLRGPMTSDKEKSAKLIQLMLERAKEKIGTPNAEFEISEKDLRAIEHAWGEFAFPVGKAVVKGAEGLATTARAIASPLMQGVGAVWNTLGEAVVQFSPRGVTWPKFRYVPDPQVDATGITQRMPGAFPSEV